MGALLTANAGRSLTVRSDGQIEEVDGVLAVVKAQTYIGIGAVQIFMKFL